MFKKDFLLVCGMKKRFSWKRSSKDNFFGDLSSGSLQGAISSVILSESLKGLKGLMKLKKTIKEGKMAETKSRYEVIAELESKKRNLILEKNSLNKTLLSKKKHLKDLKRELEDEEEETKEFEASMKNQEETLDAQIQSISETLDKFTDFKNTKK
jgi:hypothetical protein